ncbi:MAG: enoyl-CoA hydratase/isomerase family protein [Acidimicrobiaceae bacterium]|nr:enoyl-CoA hydratase/isomerase family protein [Acidimicrobiaceae bacterium]
MTGWDEIRYEVADGVATLTMHRPERRNAMTNRMVRETAEALAVAAADTSLRVLVLTGAGNTFCPGADLAWVAGGGETAPEDRLNPDHFRIPQLLHEMPAVTIAAVNGACAGAAMGWACACDLRFATRSARFNTAFLDVGVAGDMALPWSLPHLLGAAKARELMFLPDKFDADEARRIGLVARVFGDDTFAADVSAAIDRLTAASPAALSTLKRNFLDAEQHGVGDFAVVEAERHLALFRLDDTREAFAAKVEKRRPNFTGR